MERIRCIFCDRDNDNVVIQENSYAGLQCSECGLIYISPRPTFAEVVNLYGHDEARISAEAHIGAAFAKRLHAKHHLRILSSHVRRGALLEIGAGAGYFLQLARAQGFDPYAIEFNPVQADFITHQLRIPCQRSPLDPSLFNCKRFDVVYHCDVLSHFFDPLTEFRKTHEAMRDDALLMFETGNLGEVHPRYLKHFQQFQYPDHLFFFTTENLKELLRRTGFELVEIHRYSILPQLRATKAVARARNLLRRGPGNGAEPERADEATAPRDRSATSRRAHAKRLATYGWNYLTYLLRYKVGQLAPKLERPQTLIVMARKRRRGIAHRAPRTRRSNHTPSWSVLDRPSHTQPTETLEYGKNR